MSTIASTSYQNEDGEFVCQYTYMGTTVDCTVSLFEPAHLPAGHYWAEQPAQYTVIIERVYTDPNSRRQGHAKRVLLHIIDEYRKKGCCTHFLLKAGSLNGDIPLEVLVNFYGSLGFSIPANGCIYVGGVVGEVRMELCISGLDNLQST